MTPPFAASRLLTDLPHVTHGFFGRQGGVSNGDFATLNMSEASGDDPQNIARNRAAGLEALGLHALVTVKQTHSADVLSLSAAPQSGPRPEADALVTALPDLALGILTADCTPILFADPDAGIIGAAHAGWRGAVDGIIANTVAAMTALGAKPTNIRAAIGPTISGPNYEVGDDFRSSFLDRYPTGERFFFTPPGGRVHFDLPAFVEDRLRTAGLEHIENLGLCTYAEPSRFFSHRYATHNKHGAGRQIAIIARKQAR